MDFIIEICKNIAKTTLQFSVRSSKRTDQLHTDIAKYIESRNTKVFCKIEQTLTNLLGTINVDIVIYNKETQSIIGALSIKAPMNNIAQNRTNYENTKIGEAIKIMSALPDEAHFAFLDILPKECPYYTKDGSIKKIEKIDIEKTRYNQKNLVLLIQNPKLKYAFTIFAQYKYNSRREIEFESVVDVNDIKDFDVFIDSLVLV